MKKIIEKNYKDFALMESRGPGQCFGESLLESPDLEAEERKPSAFLIISGSETKILKIRGSDLAKASGKTTFLISQVPSNEKCKKSASKRSENSVHSATAPTRNF